MRDPERIDRVLMLLQGLWHANPDLRLAQLIDQLRLVPPALVDGYYVEEDEWARRIQYVIDNGWPT